MDSSFLWMDLAPDVHRPGKGSFISHIWRVDRSIRLSMFRHNRLHWSKTGQKNTQELLFHHTKLSQPCLVSSGESHHNDFLSLSCCIWCHKYVQYQHTFTIRKTVHLIWSHPVRITKKDQKGSNRSKKATEAMWFRLQAASQHTSILRIHSSR